MRWLLLILFSIGWTPAVKAEEMTVTTYYPSPRGVYTQLRTGTLEAVDTEKPYVWDLGSGEIVVSSVSLIDEVTEKKYRLHIHDGNLIVTDEKDRSYRILEISAGNERRGLSR